MEKNLNDSGESRSVHTKFSRSTFDDNILFMRDNGGRRSDRTSTPLQYLNCERFVIRSVVLSSLRSPRDAGAIFCAAFCIIQSVRRINGVKISSASVHEDRIVASREI